MREPRECAAKGFRYVMTQLGEATDMQFINHEVAPFGVWTPGRPERFRCFNDRLRHKGCAVDIVFRRAMDPRVEQTCVECERPVEPRRERIDQQFGAIETMTGLRLKWAVRAQAVTGARSKT